ncbi:MAG: hypothetical protein ABJA93_00010 [Sporichthyaceae bacterium]
MRRLFATIITICGLVGGSMALASPASARVICDDGYTHYVRTNVYRHFVRAESVTAVNRRNVKASMTVSVTQSHTSSRTFTGTITVGAEAGFWVFAKVKAEASASVALQKSVTISTTYSVTTSVPAHSSVTVDFGFRKYDQYIRAFRYYNTSATTCGRRYGQAGWVKAPVQKTFIIH